MSGSRPVSDFSAPPGTPPQLEPVVIFTRVWDRSPMWKAHTSLRAARQAVSYHRHGYFARNGKGPELWTWDGERWQLDPPPEAK